MHHDRADALLQGTGHDRSVADRQAQRAEALRRVESARVALAAAEEERERAYRALREAIVAADDVRVPITDIGRAAEVHRNTVRRIIDEDT